MAEKIKVGNIEGTKEDVVNFITESGLDISDYINSAKVIKVPFISIVICSALFFVFVCIIAVMGESYPKTKTILILISVALGSVNLCLIYMSWKNKTLTGIVTMAEVLLFSLSLNIYTPKEIVKKVEEKVSTK